MSTPSAAIESATGASTDAWLRRVHAALGLDEAAAAAPFAASSARGAASATGATGAGDAAGPKGLMLGDVPIVWGRSVTGIETQLMAQAVVGLIGPTATSAPLLEALLQTQLLLCGPAMPVFGLDVDSRTLLLMHVFSTDRDAPSDAVAMLRAMERIAIETRALLPAA